MAAAGLDAVDADEDAVAVAGLATEEAGAAEALVDDADAVVDDAAATVFGTTGAGRTWLTGGERNRVSLLGSCEKSLNSKTLTKSIGARSA